MPLTQYFEELYGVTEEQALNFWVSHLHEAIGTEQWSQICDSTGIYLASVLGHFCLQSVDRAEALSPEYNPGDQEFRQFADLTQIAELMMRQLTSAKNPLWMESAGAHILLYAGFFQNQNKNRHNIGFYSNMDRECYLMAAVGKERTNHEADGDRLQSIPLPSRQPPSPSARKQISHQAGKLDLSLEASGASQHGALPRRPSRELLKDCGQDFGLVDHDVVAAGDGFRLPRAVGAALLKEAVERGHFEEWGANVNLFGDALIGAGNLQLFGKASGRMRRQFAVHPCAVGCIDVKVRGRMRGIAADRGRGGVGNVEQRLAVGGQEGVEVHDGRDAVAKLLGHSGNYHAAIRMTDQHDPVEVLPLDFTDHIVNLRRQIDGARRQMRTLANA